MLLQSAMSASACRCGLPTAAEDGRKIVHFCGTSLLQQAAFYANTHDLRQLLSGGADVNEKVGVDGYTAVQFALYCRELGLCAALLRIRCRHMPVGSRPPVLSSFGRRIRLPQPC